jgi:hypothetical protein
MISLALIGRTPASNPDSILLKATFSGNYGVNGAGDLLNLTPISGSNPGGITDPLGLGAPLPNAPLGIVPFVDAEIIGGYYTQPTLGTTLQNCALRAYAPGGTELATNAAYPAAMLAPNYVIVEIRLPQEQV